LPKGVEEQPPSDPPKALQESNSKKSDADKKSDAEKKANADSASDREKK